MAQGKIYPPPPPSTPRLAPWEHVEALCDRLDRLIALLEGAAPPAEWPGWGPVISKLDEIKTQLSKLEIKAVPWLTKPTEEILSRTIRTTGTFYGDKMVNWTQGKRLLLKVDSSLDQGVQIQAIGNIRDAIDGHTDINTPQPCAAGGKISIGLAWDDWHPYISCEITVAVAPTTGTLAISAVVQE